MYTILKKEGRQGQIIHFLADSDDDLVLILDTCDPGSTVEVLNTDAGAEKSGVDKIHTFIKTPSGRWLLYKGKSEFVTPINNAKVAVPKATEAIGKKVVSDFQHDIQIYPTGLVTGSLIDTTSELYGDDEATGHYFCFEVVVPEGVSKIKRQIEGQEEQTAEVDPTGNIIMVRYENMTDKKANRFIVSYDTGESFTFDLSHLTLE